MILQRICQGARRSTNFHSGIERICPKFRTCLDSLQISVLNIATWSQFTSDCFWASFWLSKDDEDFKQVAMNESFKDSGCYTVGATTSANADRTPRRIQHANVTGLEHISIIKSAWSSSKTDQDRVSWVLGFCSVCCTFEARSIPIIGQPTKRTYGKNLSSHWIWQPRAIHLACISKCSHSWHQEADTERYERAKSRIFRR